MHRTPRAASFTLLAALTVLTACQDRDGAGTPLEPTTTAATRAWQTAGTHRQYGTPIRIGDGRVRAYVELTQDRAQTPVEIGVALDARALDGLPVDASMLTLPLPPSSPEPYQFVLFDWNPQGHEPPGVYDLPHFDFHFYTVPESDVLAITPSDPLYSAKANNIPTGDYVPPFYIVLAPPGADLASVAVPAMGVHWIDVRAPEVQGVLGNPAGFQPFVKTFIYGSWDGRLTFMEPMITREYLLTWPDDVIPVSQPALYPAPGWYPDAYRIRYDAGAREYRVGLVGLSWFE